MIRGAIILSLLLCGCGNVVPALLRTTATTATVTAAGYRVLRLYDVDKEAAIRLRAKTDAKGAEAELNDYAPKVKAALDALDAASVCVEGAYAEIPAASTILTGPQKAGLIKWSAALLEVGGRVVVALGTLGIKVPGLGGTP